MSGIMTRLGMPLLVALAMLVPTLAPSDAMASDVEQLYRTYCWQCHGKTGKGNGINVRDMSVNPRDHTDAENMKGLTDARIFKAIKEGGAAVTSSVLMPAWGGVLTDQEIHDLVAYLRILCDCKGSG